MTKSLLIGNDPLLSDRAATVWVNVVLIVVGINAVLIQTIVPEGSALKNIIRAAVIVVTIALIALRGSSIPPWMVGMILSSVILLLLAANTDQLTIVFVLLLTPVLWSIPRRSLDKAVLRASLISLALVFLLLVVGVTKNTLQTSITGLSTERERYTFGTHGVPFFMNLVYGAGAMTIFYGFRWHSRLKWLWASVVIGVTIYVFTQTNGRGGLISLIVLVTLMVLIPRFIRVAGVTILLAFQPVIYLALTLWLATQGSNDNLNAILSYRPRLLADYVSSVDPWTYVLSTSVKQTDVVTTVDSSYLHLLIGCGVLLFVVFCFAFGAAVVNMSHRGMTLEIAFVSSALIYGLSESILLRVENVFVIFVWYLILRHASDRRAGGERFTPSLIHQPNAQIKRLRAGAGPRVEDVAIMKATTTVFDDGIDSRDPT